MVFLDLLIYLLENTSYCSYADNEDQRSRIGARKPQMFYIEIKITHTESYLKFDHQVTFRTDRQNLTQSQSRQPILYTNHWTALIK